MASQPTEKRVNNFTVKIATANGTGSASANGLIMKSLFRMGIPVSGKNYFPSNIQGMPTWYEIRASRDGYIARAEDVDMVIAMNAETYVRDVQEVRSGGFLLYDSSWPRANVLTRDDITVLGVPLAQMCNEAFQGARNRILMKNIAYAGALAALINLDMDIIRTLLGETFRTKTHLIDSNMKAIELGYNYAIENFDCPLPFTAEKMDATAGQLMIDGNTAAGLGAVYAGATVAPWYPITPSTSLMDAFKSFAERLRKDPETGERKFTMIQAEDELAAIGMVIGANWNGARAFTATSGPGISLMSEFIGLGYFTETPAVLFDVQRVSPSTGMPTRTQQCDIMAAAYASHGDTKHVVLFPANPEESFYFAVKAFDLAERLQTPVFVLLDLDIGMNDWMCPMLEWDDSYTPDRGKVMSAEDLETTEFYRYLDVDGDAIPYRTLPGTHPEKGAFFTRGSGHNKYGQYTEISEEYVEVLDRLRRKTDTAATLVPKAAIDEPFDTDMAIISVGSCDGAVREARDHLSAQGIHLNYMRVKAFPFGQEVDDFMDRYERIFVVEQNRDAQLKSLLILETRVEKAKLESILHYDGMPMSAKPITVAIEKAVAKGEAA